MPLELSVDQILAWLVTVTAIVAIPVAALALVLRLGRRWALSGPEEVLRVRLARGELTVAEFDAALRALGR